MDKRDFGFLETLELLQRLKMIEKTADTVEAEKWSRMSVSYYEDLLDSSYITDARADFMFATESIVRR